MLQAALSEGGSALAKQQRAVEERARRLTAAENRAAMLEAEKAELQNELEESQQARERLQATADRLQEEVERQKTVMEQLQQRLKGASDGHEEVNCIWNGAHMASTKRCRCLFLSKPGKGLGCLSEVPLLATDGSLRQLQGIRLNNWSPE